MADLEVVLVAGLCVALGVWCWPPGRSTQLPRAVDQTRDVRPATVREVAHAMDLLALALESGAAVPDCLERVARECEDQVGDHLRQVATALRWGVEPRAAWSEVPDAWAAAGSALTLADAAGTPPAGHLREAAHRLRETEQHRLEIAGARVAVQLVLPLGLCFLPAFVLLTVVPVIAAMATELLGGSTG